MQLEKRLGGPFQPHPGNSSHLLHRCPITSARGREFGSRRLLVRLEECPSSRATRAIKRTKRGGPRRVYTACALCTCPACGSANFRVVASRAHGETEAWSPGQTLPRQDLPTVPAALVPEAPWEPRAPRQLRRPRLAECGRDAPGQGVRVNPGPANRGGRPGLGAAVGTHRAQWRGRPGAVRCRRPGGRGSDAAGLTAAGTLLPLLPPLPPPPGLPRPLPALGGPAPSPPSAGPSLCPRPGPRAAAWVRGGAEARRLAPRAHTPGGWTRGAALRPCSCLRAVLCACRPAGRASSSRS